MEIENTSMRPSVTKIMLVLVYPWFYAPQPPQRTVEVYQILPWYQKTNGMIKIKYEFVIIFIWYLSIFSVFILRYRTAMHNNLELIV